MGVLKGVHTFMVQRRVVTVISVLFTLSDQECTIKSFELWVTFFRMSPIVLLSNFSESGGMTSELRVLIFYVNF